MAEMTQFELGGLFERIAGRLDVLEERFGLFEDFFNLLKHSTFIQEGLDEGDDEEDD